MKIRILFFLLALVCLTDVIAQPNFVAMGNGISQANVKSIVAHNGKIYAGGSMMNGKVVVSWNGTSWDTLIHDGSLLFNGFANSLLEYNGELYLAGHFNKPNFGPSLGNVFKWSANKYSSVGFGLDGDVNALAVFNGTLCAAGEFTNTATGYHASGIARFTNGTWLDLNEGVSGASNCMVNYNTELHIGGDFKYAGSNLILTEQVARWNGSVWNPVGDNSKNFEEIYAMAVYNNELYAGGLFGISRWNGTNWSNVGSGISGGVKKVLTMCVYNGELYVGGDFTSAGGTQASSIARWDGTSWKGISSGINGQVKAMTVYNGDLYVGGSFTKAGDLTTNNIVIVRSGFAGNEINKTIGINLYPNPSVNGQIFINLDNLGIETELKFFNINGSEITKEVELLKIDESRYSCSNIPAGNYILQVKTQHSVERKKLIVIN